MEAVQNKKLTTIEMFKLISEIYYIPTLNSQFNEL